MKRTILPNSLLKFTAGDITRHVKKVVFLFSAIFCLLVSADAQTRTITGKVTDANGQPLIGASVLVKGTKIGTTTNSEGVFSLNVPSNSRTLEISSVDMTTEDVVIRGTTVDVALISSAASNLQEVVVVGYGTQKRKEVTGSLTTIKGSEIAERPVQSFEQALAGKAAGVQITVPSGVLNSPPVFRIRGTNSISLSSYPLIVIDGVVSFTGDQGSSNAPANALASLNPNDIESIDIAKDAAASAIYGSRAANGVVFITTKRGRSGKAKVSYDGWVGSNKAIRLPEILNAEQYLAYKNLALANAKAYNPAITGTFIQPKDANGQPIAINWLDEVYRKGFSHSHNVNVSGGSEGSTYYFSGGYTSQEGILKRNSFERKNVLLNVDSRVNKMVSIGGKLSYSNENNIIAGSSGSQPGEAFNSAGAARLAVALPPIVAPFNNDGTYNIGSPTSIGGMGNLINGANPFTFYNVTQVLNLNRSDNEVNHLQSNIYFQLKPLSWITLRTSYGIDNLLVDNDLFYNPYHGDGAGGSLGPGGGSNLTYFKTKTWVWTNTAQFDFTLASMHNFSFLAGNEQQRNTVTGIGINRRTLSDSAYTVGQAGFTTNNAAGLVLGENYLLSNFGRLNYNYDQKYYVSGNIRQDEYSALGIKKGTFWGVSAGWEIAKENFWSGAGLNKTFSAFKLRGSYGKVGNIVSPNLGNLAGNYPTYSNYTSGFYGSLATLQFSSVGNPQITWETSRKLDLGLSFGLFKDRFTAELVYYKNDIDGLILNVPQSPSTGLPYTIAGSAPSPPTLLANIGTMYNRGIELSLNGTPVLNKNFTWNSNFNISYNKNEVTALAEGLTEIITATGGSESVNKTLPGYSLGYLWVIRTAGVDPGTGRRIFLNKAGNPVHYHFGVLPAGQFTYQNPDGTQYKVTNAAGQLVNGAISQADDAVLYANTLPRYVGGWDNTFRFMNFDVNVLTTFQAGFSVYYGSNAGLHDQRFWNNDVDILNHWTKPGDQSPWPKPVYGDNVSNGSALPLDINVFKGDFIKLKSVGIGYTLPKSILSKAKINTVRFYVSGQNLAIITKYPGPDPEVSSNGGGNLNQGVDRNTLGNGRTIIMGLNINF